MFAQGLVNAVADECQLVFQSDVSRRGTNLDDILAWQDIPTALLTLTAVIAQLFGIEFYSDGLALAWIQRNAGKALKLKRAEVGRLKDERRLKYEG